MNFITKEVLFNKNDNLPTNAESALPCGSSQLLWWTFTGGADVRVQMFLTGFVH